MTGYCAGAQGVAKCGAWMQCIVKCESGMQHMTAHCGKNECRGRSWEKLSRMAGHIE